MNTECRDRDQYKRRVDIAFGLLALAGLLVLVLMAFWIQNLSDSLRTSNEARDALARQVQELGAKPVAGPPGSRGEPGQSVTGPKGDRGPIGPAGPTGPAGKRGPKGEKGDTGTQGDTVTGSPGANGVEGAQGAAGPAGPQGEPGPAGADGKDGEDGQTCPDGYSLQAPSYDPDALVCRKDNAPDPGDTSEPPSNAALDPNRRVYA